ncbi:MAG: tRNA pseudouridine(13) synthase TruD, partial [Planctomycetes bacterium]|nr:tRNA pseudouridine(13) synthase TruD [Planctomycetota bacterium]
MPLHPLSSVQKSGASVSLAVPDATGTVALLYAEAMKLKARSSDFVVKESLAWTPEADGNYYVYRVHKRGLSTLDAVAAIAKACGLTETRILFAGLKDKRAETEQLISVEGQPVQADVRGVQLEFLGRSRCPITSEHSVANGFQIIVRDLSRDDVERLPANLEAVERWGLPNYFDDQRFGCVRFGEGFIVKDLLLGKVEQCLRRYLTAASTFDSAEEKARKQFIVENWGNWDALARRHRQGKLHPLFTHLLRRPGDFRSAFRYLDPRLFSLHLFAYQSFIWNASAARFLASLCPPEALLRVPHVTGTLPVHAALT